MPYPENRATLDGLLIPVCKSKPFMDDLDNNQFQPNQLHVADDTVALNDAENRANHDNNNIVHLMNNREWTNKQKHRIVEINMLQRRRGKNFMRRVKERWDAEYPGIARTAQNLIENARRFKKEGWGRPVEIDNRDEMEVQQQMNNNRTSLEWTTEMKIVLVTLDQEERAKGRGFMKRVKDRSDAKYHEYQSASWQKLRDNAARFKKDPELKDIMLVRQREQIQRGEIVIENNEAEESNTDEPGMRNDEDELEIADAEELAGGIQIDSQLTEKDKELERFLIAELEQLEHSSLLHMEPRQALTKVKMDSEIQERTNKVLRLYLPSADTILEITDIIYSMEKAVGHGTGVKPKEINENGARKAEGGNRRERKLRTEMKRLRQDIARAGNKLHRWKQQRKTTKEKEIIKHLRTIMNGQKVTLKNLEVVKEQWLDKLHYKKVKLEKWVEKRNRKKDNIMFQKDQKNFFCTLEKVEKHEG